MFIRKVTAIPEHYGKPCYITRKLNSAIAGMTSRQIHTQVLIDDEMKKDQWWTTLHKQTAGTLIYYPSHSVLVLESDVSQVAWKQGQGVLVSDRSTVPHQPT